MKESPRLRQTVMMWPAVQHTGGDIEHILMQVVINSLVVGVSGYRYLLDRIVNDLLLHFLKRKPRTLQHGTRTTFWHGFHVFVYFASGKARGKVLQMFSITKWCRFDLYLSLEAVKWTWAQVRHHNDLGHGSVTWWHWAVTLRQLKWKVRWWKALAEELCYVQHCRGAYIPGTRLNDGIHNVLHKMNDELRNSWGHNAMCKSRETRTNHCWKKKTPASSMHFGYRQNEKRRWP